MRRTAGFTTIELITVIVILGILAVVALPRLNNADMRGQLFRDQTVSALRYAQKTAVSHRRTTCVAFTSSTVTATIAPTIGGACDTALLLPGQSSNVVTSQDAAALLSSTQNPLTFNSDGTSGGATIAIAGQSTITVSGATGYVK